MLLLHRALLIPPAIAAGGPALGPELVGNGGFDDGTIWNLPSGGTISGGQFAGAPANGLLWQNNAGILAGNTYRFVYLLVDIAAGSTVTPYLGASVTAGTARTVISGPGLYSEDITPGSNSEIGFTFNNFNGHLDVVSVKRVLP